MLTHQDKPTARLRQKQNELTAARQRRQEMRLSQTYEILPAIVSEIDTTKYQIEINILMLKEAHHDEQLQLLSITQVQQ